MKKFVINIIRYLDGKYIHVLPSTFVHAKFVTDSAHLLFIIVFVKYCLIFSCTQTKFVHFNVLPYSIFRVSVLLLCDEFVHFPCGPLRRIFTVQ